MTRYPLQPVTRHSPEQQGECCYAGRHEKRHPDRTTNEQFADVWFANGQGAEGCRLRLAEENENRIQLVLVRDKEEDGDGKRNEELEGK